MLEATSWRRPPSRYTVLCRILREQSSLWDPEWEKFRFPEAELLWAVVECALRELENPSRLNKEQAHRINAREFLYGDGVRVYTEWLGWDLGWFRQTVRAYDREIGSEPREDDGMPSFLNSIRDMVIP
jgi:hypothetical protein